MKVLKLLDYAEVAQSVEQGTENPRVGSSILSLGTIISGTYDIFRWCFFCLKGHKNGHNAYWVSI